MLDRRALYATSFVRAVTTSLVGVLLGVYLARLNVTGVGFGVVVSSGLAGAALAAIVATRQSYRERGQNIRYAWVMTQGAIGP